MPEFKQWYEQNSYLKESAKGTDLNTGDLFLEKLQIWVL